MVDFFEQINLIHNVLQILARHLAFVQYFNRNLEFRVFAVSAFVDFAESTFAKDVSVDVVLLFELMDARMDGHLGG